MPTHTHTHTAKWSYSPFACTQTSPKPYLSCLINKDVCEVALGQVHQWQSACSSQSGHHNLVTLHLSQRRQRQLAILKSASQHNTQQHHWKLTQWLNYTLAVILDFEGDCIEPASSVVEPEQWQWLWPAQLCTERGRGGGTTSPGVQ